MLLLNKRKVISYFFIVGVLIVLYIWQILPVIYPYGFINYLYGISVSQPNCKRNSEKYYLTMSAVVKNRANYMAEWIEFHLMQGVQHIYIYDNESTDNLKRVLYPYIKNSLVTYTFFPKKTIVLIDGSTEILTQKLFLANTIGKHACETRWMALLDVDEFVFSVDKNSLADTLTNYEDYTSVVLPWLYFTSNNLVMKPPEGKLIIESYTRRWKKPKHTWKQIVQPKRVRSVYSSHNYQSISGYYSVTEKMLPFANWPASFNGVITRFFYDSDKWYSFDVFRLHHYKLKSAEDWEERLKIGRVTGNDPGVNDIAIKNHWEEFFYLDNIESEYDNTMAKYVKTLRNRLEETESLRT